jgi:hypothetical protein
MADFQWPLAGFISPTALFCIIKVGCHAPGIWAEPLAVPVPSPLAGEGCTQALALVRGKAADTLALTEAPSSAFAFRKGTSGASFARLRSRKEKDKRSFEFKFDCQAADTSPHSRGGRSPSFASLSPRKKRAQGMPGARCTRSLACKIKNTRVSHHRFTGAFRHSPRDGFPAYSALSLVTGLSCHHRLQIIGLQT